MSDTYVELLIKKKTSFWGNALRTSCIFMGVFQLVLYVFSKAWFFVGTALVFFGMAYTMAFLFKVEYEYLLLGTQLSIDKIFNQRKRKKVAEYELATDMEMLAPVASSHLERYRQMASRTRDFSAQSKDSEVYGLVVHVEKEIEMIKIEMTDDFFAQISMIAPRKVFKD